MNHPHLSRHHLVLTAAALAALALLGMPTQPEAASPSVIITEIMANALDENTGEYLEVYNLTEQAIDLATWDVLDAGGLRQDLVAFGGSSPLCPSSTVLPAGGIGIVLDKDYAGQYETFASHSASSCIALSTSKGNLSLANGADGITLLDEIDTNIDTFSWTADPGSEIPFARQKKLDGSFDVLVPDLAGGSLGFVREEQPAPVPPSLAINELLPNPGEDQSEFLELINLGTSTVALEEITVRDASGDRKTLTGELSAGALLLLQNDTLGISLNNAGDTVELLFGSEQLILDQTEYQTASSNIAWARFENSFSWTGTPTPGTTNHLSDIAGEPDQAETTDDTAEPTTDSLEEAPFVINKLSELRETTEDTLVRARGVASTVVGVFYKDSFHLVDQSGGAVIKLPAATDDHQIKPGTLVEIVGFTDMYYATPRITAETITVVGEQDGPSPLVLDNLALKEEMLGRLVTVQGTVSRRSTKSFAISNGKNSLLVSIRAGSAISQKAPKKGAQVTVTGIVLASGKQLVVAPRSVADLGMDTLTKTGAPLLPLVIASAVSALLLSLAERGRAEWLGRLRSSQDHAAR